MTRFDKMVQRPWDKSIPPPSFAKLQTMLIDEEQRLLYYITHQLFANDGAIIDAGCFLGGSTFVLAQGLKDSGKAGAVHSFDLFVADHYSASNFSLGTAQAGDSIRHVFDSQIAPIRDYVRVYEGDITSIRWGRLPIEVLFIDVAKSTSINDHILTEFFPRLIAGQSIVIQQDYLHEYLPWIHVTMEKLGTKFCRLADTGMNSVVFGCIEPISESDVASCLWNRLTWGERYDLHSRAERSWAGDRREYLVKAAQHLHNLEERELSGGR